jgi:hypothetical protein
MDVTGDIRSDLSQNVYKSRLDEKGLFIDAARIKGTVFSKDGYLCV